jgi:endonuclease YncB( thermonuclease family)
MKKSVLLIIVFLFYSNGYCQTILSAKVIGIKDGDTVEIIDKQNNTVTLRLAEVDCPEKKQPFGTKAKQFTADLVYLKTIKYIVTNKDRYGRYIAKIYFENKYLSAEIIKKGMGWQYKKYSTSKELAKFEQQARSKKIGLWIDPNPIYPSEWRKAKKSRNRKSY